MSKKPRIPSYRLHKASGQAVVVLAGRSYYLGKFGSPTSKAEYERILAEWLANHRQPPDPFPANPHLAASVQELSIDALILAYWQHVQSYYVKGGKPTSEQDTIRQALRFVRKLYGPTSARNFSPLALKAVRQSMIEHPITRTVQVRNPETQQIRKEVKVLRQGLSRRHINKQIGRIKRMFAWAVENELVPAEVHQGLLRVHGLRKDSTTAREKEHIRPVDNALVEAVLPLVPPTIRAMIQVQRLCGGRPQDLVEMKPCDIDSAGPVWEYRPGRHKAQHHDKERVVFLGPRAQEALRPFLEGIRADEYVFSPLRAEAARLQALRQRRGRPAVKPVKDRGKWKLRDHYDAGSYRRAIRRACLKGGIPVWCPLQLRHLAGTAIRQQYGLEASQAVLGHAELSVTQVYAEVDQATARKVMAEIG